MNSAIRILNILICLVAAWLACSSPQSATASPDGPFRVRGFHVPFRPNTAPLADYLALFDELAEKGYNTVFLSTGSVGFSVFKMPELGVIKTDGVTAADFQTLISHARRRGLEPVLEIKLIGKQRAVLDELAKSLPGLLCAHEGQSRTHDHQVINPDYVLPDGRDMFKAIVFPEIDYFLGLYGADKPKYFLLGIDEFSVDELDLCAKKKGSTAAALFADALNRITGHVLARGVTPIIWGDMLLSHRLAQPGHGVEGFTHDPRMNHPQFAYHAEFLSKRGVSVLTAMNSLRRRDEIVVADWQYGPGDPNGEFPSVDYFRKMGFKDVWGTTWYNQTGMRNFSRYAASKGCGGMIASTWHTFLAKDVKHLLPVILRNSIAYFKNPAFPPPIEFIPLAITGEGAPKLAAENQPPLFQRPLQAISFQAQLPPGVIPIQPVLRVQGALGRRTCLTDPVEVRMNYLAQERRLEAQIELPAKIDRLPLMFDTFMEFTCAENGYFVQSHQRNCFGIIGQSPPSAGRAAPDALFYADFSGLPAQAFQGGLVRAGGKFGGLVFIEPPKQPAQPQDGALDFRWMTAAYAYPPAGLWETIYAQGMRLGVEFRVGGGAQGNQFPTILGYGTFHSGFRLFFGPNNQVVLSIARGKDGFSGLQITCPHKPPAGRWTSLEMTLTPPDAHRRRTVSLRVGDTKAIVAELPIDIVKSECPLSLGVEFDSLGKLADSKWKKFPGLLRKVELAPYAKIAQQPSTPPQEKP